MTLKENGLNFYFISLIGGKLLNFLIVTCFAYVLVQQVYKTEVINKILTKSRYYFLIKYSVERTKEDSVSLYSEMDKNKPTKIEADNASLLSEQYLCCKFNVNRYGNSLVSWNFKDVRKIQESGKMVLAAAKRLFVFVSDTYDA